MTQTQFVVESTSRKLSVNLVYTLAFDFARGSVSFTKKKNSCKTFACASFLKLNQQSDAPRKLTVTLAHHDDGHSHDKVLCFKNQGERDLFCKLVLAVIVCGTHALRAWQSVDPDLTNVITPQQAQDAVPTATSCHTQQQQQQQQEHEPDQDSSAPNKEGSESLSATETKTDHKPQTHSEGEVVDLPAFFLMCSHSFSHTDKQVALLHGEKILVEKDHVTCADGNQDAQRRRGSLVLTNFRLHFREYDAQRANVADIPIGAVFDIKRARTQFIVQCKDARQVTFGFDASDSWVDGFLDSLIALAYPNDQSKCFAFQHTNAEEQQDVPDDRNGWLLYDAEREYQRLGLADPDNADFRVCRANQDYKLSPTYPKIFIVPAQTTDDDIGAVCAFRSRGRLPAVVWQHPETRATISRCSQPLTGLKGKRSQHDEAMVRLLGQRAPRCQQLHIIDARPFKAAVGNIVMGKGYENTANYHDARLHFMNIDNIHAIRASHQRLSALLAADEAAFSDSSFGSDLESTNWLYYLRLVLSSSVEMVDLVGDRGASLLVHCSDGWDRTSQLCALAEIMLDPFYRTIRGFCILIEKEWLSFGHKFAERTGHATDDIDNEQRAPIFLQFVDCVFQVVRQFPLAFEFTDHLLVIILDHLYSCRFGTFLFNNERERHENELARQTTSLWTHILSDDVIWTVRNPVYRPSSAVLRPNTSAKKIVLWEKLFLRWDQQCRVHHSEANTDHAVAQLRHKYEQLLRLAKQHNLPLPG